MSNCEWCGEPVGEEDEAINSFKGQVHNYCERIHKAEQEADILKDE